VVDTLNECPHRLSCYKLLKNNAERRSAASAFFQNLPKRDAYNTLLVFCVNTFLKIYFRSIVAVYRFP
ncbi:hypothetical protein, partial [Alteromonas alba]|uniref:hypothetical protein n=1 Tax=Alteromonas alba TaxID=2079529 RepID=UPI00196AC008